MTQLPFLNEYSGESVDELLGYKGRFRTDSIVLTFEKAIKSKRTLVKQISREERMVLAIESLQREVNNGGYHQFFFNSSREHVPVIVDALTRIGCDVCADITRNAIDVLEIDKPLSSVTVAHALRGMSRARIAKLSACDEAYYANVRGVSDALFAFLEAHRDKLSLL